MEVIVTSNYEELSEVAAEIIIDEMKENEEITLGLATGSSPVGVYQKLIQAHKAGLISFRNTKTYNLDEYIGLSENHNQSYYYFMFDNLFNHVDIKKENIHIPNGDKDNIIENINNYQKMLDENPRDIQVLGLGSNGHIAFNEPGTSFDSTTHSIELTKETREDNKRFFDSIEEVPSHAITIGIKDIMAAKKIVIVANGEGKANTIKELLEGYRTEDFPASILLDHSDVTLVIDEAAASLLEEVEDEE